MHSTDRRAIFAENILMVIDVINFSVTVKNALKKRNKSKRWLYLQLGMTPQTFEERLKRNDWRIGEIVNISTLLNIK